MTRRSVYGAALVAFLASIPLTALRARAALTRYARSLRRHHRQRHHPAMDQLGHVHALRRAHPLHLRPALALQLGHRHLLLLPPGRRLPRRGPQLLLAVAHRRLPHVAGRGARRDDPHRLRRHAGRRQAEARVRLAHRVRPAVHRRRGAVRRHGDHGFHLQQ